MPFKCSEIYANEQLKLEDVHSVEIQIHANSKDNVLVNIKMWTRIGSHTRTVVRECCKGDDASQWETEIWPLATPKPLNRSSQKVAHVITSWISTDVQKFSHDPSRGFFSPYARNWASKMFTRLLFWVRPTLHSQDPRTDFHVWYVKRRGSAQGYAFSGLEDKNLTFTPVTLENPPFWASFWRDLRKFSA